jgi:lysozyme
MFKILAVFIIVILFVGIDKPMVVVDKISQKGIDLIKRFEGYTDHSYICAGGKWTIGWGSTIVNGIPVKEGDKIDPDQAERALVIHLDSLVCPAVKQNVRVDINQNQFDALCSFIYNVGAPSFINSTLLRKLNASDYAGAANQFSLWVYANKKLLAGLVKRRKAERELFLSTSMV